MNTKTLIDQLKSTGSFLQLIFGNYQKDGCQSTAAALTYQTLFAVVPALTIMYSVLAAFEAFEGTGEQLQSFLFENLLPENVAVVEEYLQEFSDQARQLSIPSLVVLAITAFLMMFTIERTFNQIWRVRDPRQGFQRMLMYWAILSLGPPLMIVGMAISTYIVSLPLFSDDSAVSGLLNIVPVLLSTLVFSLMYITIPNCMVPIRHGLIGGFIVAVMFEAFKQLFGTVMALTDFAVIYGTFAAVPLFLIWLYLSWTIVLFGAELTKSVSLFRSKQSDRLEPPLIQLVIILREFFEKHRVGDVVSEKQMMAMGRRIDLEEWHEYKSHLLSLGLIRTVDKGGLVLSKDLNEVTLWDLYQSSPWPLPEGFGQAGEGWEAQLDQNLKDIFQSSRSKLECDLEHIFRGEKT